MIYNLQNPKQLDNALAGRFIQHRPNRTCKDKITSVDAEWPALKLIFSQVEGPWFLKTKLESTTHFPKQPEIQTWVTVKMDDFCRFGPGVYSLSSGSAHFCHRLQFLPWRWACIGWVSRLRQEKKTKTPKTPKTPGSSDNQQSSQGVPRRRREFFVQ